MKVVAIEVLNVQTGKKENWTMRQVLAEINRDHSDEFIPYAESDWREGWVEWVDNQYYRLAE